MSLEAAGSKPVSATMKAVRSVFDMSAAFAGGHAQIATHVAAIINIVLRRERPGRDIVIVVGLLAGGGAARDVEIVILPRILIVHRVLEAQYPRLDQNVLVAVGVEHPWRIRIDEL